MEPNFRHGELIQRGRGAAGGFFRGLFSLLRPSLSTLGKSVVQAAKSDTAKSIGKTLGRQALDTGLNITHAYLQGKDMKDEVDREAEKMRMTGSQIIKQVQAAAQNRKRKSYNPEVLPKKKKKPKPKPTPLKKFKPSPSLQRMKRYDYNSRY